MSIITGHEVTKLQHIGQVVGDFVGAGDIDFPTILVRKINERFPVGVSLRDGNHNIQISNRLQADSALIEEGIGHGRDIVALLQEIESGKCMTGRCQCRCDFLRSGNRTSESGYAHERHH
jgi:hypothetical protein